MSTDEQTKLRALADKLMAFGSSIFDEHGPDYLMPLWHGQSDDGPDVVIGTTYELGAKDAIAEVLRNKFREAKVIRCAHLTEAWIRTAKPDEKDVGGQVSEHPDRREIMLVTAEDKHGNSVMLQRFILRPEHGKACLMPVEAHKSFTSPEKDALKMQGRFTHMLTY